MVIKKIIILFTSTIICACFTVSSAIALPKAQLTAKIVDEQGMPMEGVKIVMGFFTGGSPKETTVTGVTDASGRFTGTERAAFNVAFKASKDGYYQSYIKYVFNEPSLDRWQPWNPEIQLVLRKIGHPVPMYARDTMDTRLEIPVTGKEVGFDLIEYDWVSPYGKGKYSDFIFNLDRKFDSEDKFEVALALTFSNKYDGIRLFKENRRYGSQLKLLRIAPKYGYDSKLVRTKKRIPGKGIEEDYQEDNNYIFRVRSEEKEKRFERAMYGKIHGDIRVDPRGSKTAIIMFKYYLNPDYTQNLEYDPNQNLFLNLRDRRKLEWVGLE